MTNSLNMSFRLYFFLFLKYYAYNQTRGRMKFDSNDSIRVLKEVVNLKNVF